MQSHTQPGEWRHEAQLAGLSRRDVVVCLGVAAIVAAIGIPAILHARAAARLQTCQTNLRTLSTALWAYHDTHEALPPAAVWTTDHLRTLGLHQSKRHDRFIMANWAQAILPQTDHHALVQNVDTNRLLADPANTAFRTHRLRLMNCPDDEFNIATNPYVFAPTPQDTIEYARGNYAINGGSHSQRWGPGSAADPVSESGTVEHDAETRTFRAWGNGVAGINRRFGRRDFANGLATLVLLDEVRAGVHSVDPRGVWALGHLTSSVTWGHGANSDDYGPNQQWGLADDIQGCGALHDTIGTERLMELGMPCVSYVDYNQQATARSRHTGGANVLLADGQVRLVSNAIDPGIWHALHSRETPATWLDADPLELLAIEQYPEAAAPASATTTIALPDRVENTIGMHFVSIPAGSFTMGSNDRGNDEPPPVECPAHTVTITQPFLMATHEVTQQQFESIMGTNPSWHIAANLNSQEAGDQGTGQFPVESVRWTQAQMFCQRLSELTAELEARRTYRLPTEAEWEYCCRAGKSTPYRWHGRRRLNDKSGEAAGILPPLPIRAVGSYPPNSLGLYDMRGNVWEWCADWFDRDYYARSRVNDPTGPAKGFLKVVRGGDWTFVGRECRINYPMSPPWKCSRFIGFRVICERRPVPEVISSPLR